MDLIQFSFFIVLLWVILPALESIRPAYKMAIFRKETFNDCIYAYFNKFVTPVLVLIVIDFLNNNLLNKFVVHHVFADYIQNFPFGIQVFIAILIADFATYVRHRFMHEFLWPFHSIHHMVNEINWLTKFRLHPAEAIIANIFVVIIAHILGFDGEAIISAGIILLGFDLFNHLNINISFPKPLSYLLSCPNYHKWHHAKEKEAVNKNYVVVFPFLDLIFGSYYFPTHRLPKECGVFEIKVNGKEYKASHNIAQQFFYPFIFYYKKIFKSSK